MSSGTSEPVELLLIASETSDPFATKIIAPQNGVASWSYRGSELQGAVTGCVEPLGVDGDVVLISSKESPLLHALSVNPHRRRHVKSVLAGPAENMLTTADGALLFVSIGSQLFTWMAGSGELLSVVEAHYQRVSCMCLSSDGTFLISGSDDGSVNVFHLADLARWDIGSFEKQAPYRAWRVHSLSVKAVCSARCGEPRVVSCAVDHTTAIHSIARDQCLLKVSGDQPLTSCAIDPLGRCVFVGTDSGSIAQINLYAWGSRREGMIVTSGEGTDELPLFVGHSAAITRLQVNHDGRLLASGDTHGFYFVWDVFSRQCLVCTQTRGSICKLLFIWKWSSIQSKEYASPNTPLAVLQRQRSQSVVSRQIVFPPRKVVDIEMDAHEKLIMDDLNKYINRAIAEELSSDSSDSEENGMENVQKKDEHAKVLCESQARDADVSVVNESENVRTLKAKIAELEHINKQLYSYAASLILDEE